MKKFIIPLCLIIIMNWITACTLVKTQGERTSNSENIALSLIEKFIRDGISLDEVKERLGKPHKALTFKDAPDETAYYYRNKTNNLHEWGLGVNKSNQVTWITHTPWDNPLLDRVEILPKTLKKYHCKKKSKPDNSTPDVVRRHRFFECANGKIRAHYNKYGEIGEIDASKEPTSF